LFLPDQLSIHLRSGASDCAVSQPYAQRSISLARRGQSFGEIYMI
jgi:hypothetical protein